MKLALAVVAALASLLGAGAGVARANGRPPRSMNVLFRPGNAQDILAPMTFGLLRSTDGGTTWRWMCETAIGYGGTYDPDYAFSSTGAVFATTFAGLGVMRDGCTFAPTTLGDVFVASVAIGPDGTLLVAASEPTTMTTAGDSKIYRSTDDGVTFGPSPAEPGVAGDWWESVEFAPSDASRVYLSGYRINPGLPKTNLLFVSTDGGVGFTPLPLDDLAGDITDRSDIQIAAVSPTDPDIVILRITFRNGKTIGDAIYRSTDGGQNWVNELDLTDAAPGVAIRPNGDAIVATRSSGLYLSTGEGAFAMYAATPEVECLAERPGTGELWVCANALSDGYALGKSMDAMTWTPITDFHAIAGPVACAAGTAQRDECQDNLWCGLRAQLGITSTEIDCSAPVDAALAIDAGAIVRPPEPGCCNVGGGPAGSALLVVLVAPALARRRRQRR